MKFIIPLLFLLLTSPIVSGQVIRRHLKFEPGQLLVIKMEMKSTVAQQAMGRAIDFHVDANALHTYKVTNATDENTTLHHELKRLQFTFDGMGFNRTFDSDNENDMAGHMGKPVKELLDKTYDMLIDTAGTVLMVQPEKTDLPVMDDRFAVIGNMLKDVFAVVQPPEKSQPSFFGILPPGDLGLTSTWSDSSENANGKFRFDYTISSITDSSIVISFTGKSVTVTTAQMMGNTTHTTMNNKSAGKITLDRASGIMREKFITIESNGTTEIMGSSVPVTTNTSVIIKVE